MRLGFRPGLWPTIATVVATLLFVRLGFWQLRRAHEAEAQKRAYLARVKEPPSPLTGGQWRPEALRFRRVVVRGRYEARYQILLDNQFNGPGVGYEVLTPLHLLGSRDRVLVNRGWVPLVGGQRRVLPSVPPPGGVQQIVGLAVVPGRYFRLGRPRPVHPWHVLWEYQDLRRYAQAVPFPVEPVVLLLAPDSHAGGFVRHWPPAGTGVAMHQGYALQWFLFALSAVIIYVVVNRPKRRPR